MFIMRVSSTLACLVVAIVSYTFLPACGENESKDCEVCTNVMEKIKEKIIHDGLNRSDRSVIELAIDQVCEGGRLHPREEKMCYYLKPIKKEVSHIFSLGIPMEQVCKRLQSSNSEICSVKYPIKLDYKNVDFSKIRVKQLKQILNDRGVDCVACTEKSDYIDMVKATNNMEL